jgi:hypothetical protein
VTFKAFDRDSNGFIDEQELLEMIITSYDFAVKTALTSDKEGRFVFLLHSYLVMFCFIECQMN